MSKHGPTISISRLDSMSLLKGGTALDIGSGHGRDSLFLRERGYAVTAMDKSAAAIRESAAGTDISIVEADVSDAILEEGAYDIVTANNVIPFVSKEKFVTVLERMVASAKPGGYVCFSLFGKDDEWAQRHSMHFETYAEALDIVSKLPASMFHQSTEKGYSSTMAGSMKFLEIHRFILKKE